MNAIQTLIAKIAGRSNTKQCKGTFCVCETH